MVASILRNPLTAYLHMKQCLSFVGGWVKLFIVALASGLLFSQLTWSQESSKIKIDEVKETNKTQGEDVDEVITNSLLRAESGSKSKLSIATAFNYNGGSIQTPLSEDRPNVAASTGTIPKSNLQGQTSVKYNLNSRNSLMLGVGMRWISPLSSSGPHDFEGQRFDADNPYLTYQYLYKWLGIQSVMQVQALAFTNSDLLAEGYVGQLQFDQENMYELGESGVSVGASTWVALQSFNKTGPVGKLDDVRSDQSDYSFGIQPCVEYQFNDRFNLRAITSLWVFEHTRDMDAGSYFQDKIYESVGVGITVTRDIYLFPNISFLPEDIRSDRTNIGLNTNINVF
jgi:hypothetical protein